VYNDNKKKAAKQKNVGAGSVAKKSGCVWLVPNNKKGGGRSKKKGMVPGCLIWSRVRKQTRKMVAGILVGWFLVLGRDFGWVGFDWFLGRCGFVGVAYNKKKQNVGVPLGPLVSGPVGSFRGSGVGGFDITLELLASVEKVS